MGDERIESFGQRLRRLRQTAGLTQEELAERANVAPNAISALERGERRRPYPHTVRALTEALALSPDVAASLMAVVPSRTAARPTEQRLSEDFRLPLGGSLVGREREFADLIQLLQQPDVRLVTLTGPGGVGKTSLAMHLVDAISDRYSDGAHVVALASLVDPTLVIPTIAHVYGLREAEGQTARHNLHAYLREKKMLLVLDNLEHLITVAPEIAQLLAASRGLTVLATSRAPLRLRGEREYPIRPLDVPELTRLPAVADLEGNPAVDLFVERARAVNPAFELTRHNAAAVAAICRRLDGLPLALELAAARIRTLSPTTLLARLDQSLPLLADGARDLPDRQRTMERAIGWSYDLLDTAQQSLFRRLSVFAGGWTLQAPESICVGDDLRGGVHDHLAALVEQSLVLVEPGEERRFRLLEPVRQYAKLRLEVNREGDDTRHRQAAFYAVLAKDALPQLKSPDQIVTLAMLEAENDNLRQAMGWLIERREMDQAASFAFSLWLFWWMRGLFTEGLRWTTMILEPSAESSPWARAWASLTAGVLLYGRGDYERAAVAVDGSHHLFRQVYDEPGAYTAIGMAGLIAISRNDYERGAILVEEGVRLSQAAGDTWNMLMLRTYSAAIPLSRGDYAEAERFAREGLALARSMGDRIGVYVSLFSLASIARAKGDRTGAARFLQEALALSVEIGDRGNVAYCLEGLAAMAAGQDDLVRAARLWGAAEALLEGSEAAVYVHTPDRAQHAEAVAAARSRLDSSMWTSAWSAGRTLSLADAASEADDLAAEIANAASTPANAARLPRG
jgi:predicted ATPase/DNA-binding XRE family transcriptional regulator